MTREEEIRNAVDTTIPILPSNDGRTYEQALMATGFENGVKWADTHPKSPWINVEDDLPCNHEELIRHPRITKYVMVMYKDGAVALDRMVKRNDGYWRFVGAVTHWFPMPKLPNRRIDYGN